MALIENPRAHFSLIAFECSHILNVQFACMGIKQRSRIHILFVNERLSPFGLCACRISFHNRFTCLKHMVARFDILNASLLDAAL